MASSPSPSTPQPSATPKFLIQFSQSHPSFRLGEIYSCAKQFGFRLRLDYPHPQDENDSKATTSGEVSAAEDREQGSDGEVYQREVQQFVHEGRSAFVVITFLEPRTSISTPTSMTGTPEVEIKDLGRCIWWAGKMGERCITLRSISHLYSSAPTLPLLHSSLAALGSLNPPHTPWHDNLPRPVSPRAASKRRKLWGADDDRLGDESGVSGGSGGSAIEVWGSAIEVQGEKKRQGTWAFEVLRVNRKRDGDDMRRVIESFQYLNLQGPISLKSPEAKFVVFEEYVWPEGSDPTLDSLSSTLTSTPLDSPPNPSTPSEADPSVAEKTDKIIRRARNRAGIPTSLKMRTGVNNTFLKRVYLGRQISEGKARHLLNKYEVKDRAFYGNTSMESEMSLLMAGQTLSAPGKIIYDPFVGTGSLLYTCAEWGGMVYGSDIDGRQVKGKGDKTPGIFRAANKFGFRDNFLDVLTFDVTRNPWREGGLFDAIITDPPYGVRAGAKRLGRKEDAVKRHDEPVKLPDGTWSHENPNYIPVSRPYEMTDLVHDLVEFSRYMLVKGGRLVFFLPTVTEDWDEIDLPVVEGMREIKFCDGAAQDFGKWSRRLITMERVGEESYPRPTFLPVDRSEEAKVPGHQNFAARYYYKAPEKAVEA